MEVTRKLDDSMSSNFTNQSKLKLKNLILTIQCQVPKMEDLPKKLLKPFISQLLKLFCVKETLLKEKHINMNTTKLPLFFYQRKPLNT